MPCYKSYHLHLPHFHFDSSHNLKMLFGLRVTRELSNYFAFFFLPLFLFQLGPKVNYLNFFKISSFQAGMLALGLYFIIYRSVVFVSSIPLAKLAIRFLGFKNIFVISSFFRVCVFLVLRESVSTPSIFLWAPLLDGVGSSFFWPAFHTFFSTQAKSKNVGQDLGFLQFLLQFVTMVSPALGGLVAVFLGFESLFLFGLILTMVGTIFTAAMHQKKMGVAPSWSEFVSWIRERQYLTLCFTFVGRYVNDSVLGVWPLYVFFLLGSIDGVGFLYSLSLFIAMILSFFVGFYIDHHKGKKPFFISGGFVSLIWFLRIGVFNAITIAFVDAFNKIISSFHWLFYDKIVLLRGKGKHSYPYFIYREMIIGIGGMVFWIFFIALFMVTNDWKTLFILAAIASLSSLLVKERVRKS